MPAGPNLEQRLREKVLGPHPSRRCQWHDEPFMVRDCELLRQDPDTPGAGDVVRVRFRAELVGCGHCVMEDVEAPPEYRHVSFESFSAATEQLAENLAKAREFSRAPAGFLFMLGNVGTGKTHLALSCLREHGKGLYSRHGQIIQELRDSYGKPGNGHSGMSAKFAAERWGIRDHRDRCRHDSLIVLDELGIAPGGNDAETLLYEILDHRLTQYLPTILCANIAPKDFESVFGSRIADRFRMAQAGILSFTGKSFREPSRTAYLARARDHASKNPHFR